MVENPAGLRFRSHAHIGGAKQEFDFVGSQDEAVIPAGETVATGVVYIEQDSIGETDERLTIELYNPIGATIADGDATTIIIDDQYQNRVNMTYSRTQSSFPRRRESRGWGRPVYVRTNWTQY